ncbi:LTA synthase family protein [Clostridium sp.]|uniref:LTA synthase family protein n=1 Tax=Clostridium sp. TaxID=1506 RepID=UPI002FCB42FD
MIELEIKKTNTFPYKYKRNVLYIFNANKLFLFILIIFLLKSIIVTALIQSPGASVVELKALKNSISLLLPYTCFALVILSTSYLFKEKKHTAVLVIFDILFTAMIISDLCYYRGFSSYLNFYLLDQISMTEDLGGSILALFRPIDVLFILDIIMLPLIISRNHRSYINKNKSITTFICLALFSLVYLTFRYGELNHEKNAIEIFAQDSFSNFNMPNDKMLSLGPIGYHIFEGYSYFTNKRPYKLSSNEIKEIEEFYRLKEEVLPENQYMGKFKGKNLLLIQVESLESFILNEKVNGQEVTPNINKLLSNSIYFSNFYEQVWNGNSSDCDLLVNGSVYPVREGATFYRYPNNYYPHSLPNVMKSLGYNTYIVHPDTAWYWNYEPALTSLEFDKLYFEENLNVTEKIGLGISDEEYFKQTFKIIEEQKQPFYGLAVTITSHTPFDLPEKYQYLSLKEELNKSEMGKYFQAIHYTDKQIGMFLEKLEKDGLLDNTVVVLYGDHTGVHKYFGDKIKDINEKEKWWMNNNNKVPLLIYNKNSTSEIIDIHGGPVDLVPTLSYLMGADKNSYKTAMGRNLLNTRKDFVLLSNFQVKGNLTEEEKRIYKEHLLLSDKIIRSNYFKK